MGGLNNKSNIKDNKNCFENENNLLNSDNNNYGNIIFIPLILDQIIQFLDDYDKKNLYLCNKKFYQLYCNQITDLIIFDKVNKSKVKKTLNKYKNVESLKIVDCNDISFLDENCNIKSLNLRGHFNCALKIKDFSPLFRLNKLEILDIHFTDITNISFLKNIKNLNELHLYSISKKTIIDSTPISYLEKLEVLELIYTNINNFSFLKNTNQIKKLEFNGNIKNYNHISNLEKLEILSLRGERLSSPLYNISFLENNKNIKCLYIINYKKIKDYHFISKLDKLEILEIKMANIDDISFLENIKILKV